MPSDEKRSEKTAQVFTELKQNKADDDRAAELEKDSQEEPVGNGELERFRLPVFFAKRKRRLMVSSETGRR